MKLFYRLEKNGLEPYSWFEQILMRFLIRMADTLKCVYHSSVCVCVCVCLSVCLSVCLPVKCGSTHSRKYLGLLVGSVGIEMNRGERARGKKKKGRKGKDYTLKKMVVMIICINLCKNVYKQFLKEKNSVLKPTALINENIHQATFIRKY